MQLVQEISTARKIWGVQSGSTPVPAVSPLNSEVLGPVMTDQMSNNMLDGFQVLSLDNKIIMTAGVGGTGCVTPNSPIWGCYRLQIFRASSPLGHHIFNSEVARSPQLASNPQEYNRIFYTPEGETFIMGMMLPPTLAGTQQPSNTTNIGVHRYPIDLSKLSFTTNTAAVNPTPNPQSSVEVMSMSIDVLELFVNSCYEGTTNSLSCRSAVSRYCINHGYSSGGHGPNDQSPAGIVNFSCFKNHGSISLVASLANLKKHVPACNGYTTPDCNAASARHCQSLGYEGGGFGPSEFDGVNAKITCFKSPNGFAVATTYSALSSIHPACTSTANVNSMACNSAVKHFCVSRNYKSAYGIMEHNGNDAVVGCAN